MVAVVWHNRTVTHKTTRGRPSASPERLTADHLTENWTSTIRRDRPQVRVGSMFELVGNRSRASSLVLFRLLPRLVAVVEPRDREGRRLGLLRLPRRHAVRVALRPRPERHVHRHRRDRPPLCQELLL